MITVNTAKIKTNQHLSRLAIQFSNNTFQGDRLAPPFMVTKESDKYREYKRDGYFSGAPIRNDGAKAEKASLSYDDKTYSTKERALKDIVTDRAVDNADDVFNLKADVIRFLSDKIKLGYEIDQATALLATDGTGVSTSNPDHLVTPTNLWDDLTNSDPKADIATGKESIMKQSGRIPNILAIPGDVEKFLGQHPQIDELRKYIDKSALTDGGVPSRLWGLDVVILPAVRNNAKQGIDPVNMAYVWGKNALIAYVNPADNLSYARTFVLASRNMRVDQWRDEEIEGQWQRIVKNYQAKVLCNTCGYLLQNIIA